MLFRSLEDTDFHACCREDRLDAARTDRMVQELETLAGTDCDLPLPRDARPGAVITVDSFVGRGAHWLSLIHILALGFHQANSLAASSLAGMRAAITSRIRPCLLYTSRCV